MPIQTKIKFRDYVKAIEVLAERMGYELDTTNKSGSGIRFDLLKKGLVVNMWVAHRSDKVYSDDLKKGCANLGVSPQDLEELVKNKFK